MEMIIVKSKIKEVAKNSNVASDFVDKLNEIAHENIKLAEKRASSNGRKTIKFSFFPKVSSQICRYNSFRYIFHQF